MRKSSVRSHINALLPFPLGRFQVGALATLGTETTSRALGLATTIVFIRALSVASYAFMVLFLAVGAFVGTSITGGIQMRYLRTEAERVSRRAPDVEFSFTTALLLEIALISALALIVGLGAGLLGLHPGPTDATGFIFLCTLFSISQAAIQLTIYHYQAHLQFGKAGVVNIVRSGVIVIVAVLVIAGFATSGIAAASIMTVVSLIAAIILSSRIIMGKHRPVRWRRLMIDSEVSWLTIFYLASAGFATIDIFIVAALLHQKDLAAFGAAQRYYAFALGVGPALLAVVRVRTSQSDVIDSPAQQIRMLRSWVKRAGIPVLVGGVLLALVAPFVIPIVDAGRYPASIPTFQLLLIGACAYYVMMPASSLLMAQGRYRALALAVLGAFTANAIGDFVAVEFLGFGIVAIAAVASITYLGFFVATALLTMRAWKSASSTRLSARMRPSALVRQIRASSASWRPS